MSQKYSHGSLLALKTLFEQGVVCRLISNPNQSLHLHHPAAFPMPVFRILPCPIFYDNHLVSEIGYIVVNKQELQIICTNMIKMY